MIVQPWFRFGEDSGAYGQGQAAKYFASACPINGVVLGTNTGESATYGPWTTPAGDAAVWYDATVPASAGFLVSGLVGVSLKRRRAN